MSSGRNYSVDDILNEIKSKKQAREGGTPIEKAMPLTSAPSAVKPAIQVHDEPIMPASSQPETKMQDRPSQPPQETKSEPEATRHIFPADPSIKTSSNEDYNREITSSSERERLVDKIKHIEPDSDRKVRGVEYLDSTKDIRLEDMFYDRDEYMSEEERRILERGRNKALTFKLSGEEEENDESDKNIETAEQTEEIDDYNSYDDTESVYGDLGSIKAGLTVRLIITLVATVLMGYVVMASPFALPMYDIVGKNGDPLMFASLIIALFGVGIVCSIKAVIGGAAAFFTGKPDSDNLLFLAAFAAMTGNVAAVIMPDSLVNTPGVEIYSIVVMFMFIFNILGKMCIISRIKNNFKFVSSRCDKFSIEGVQSESLVKRILGSGFADESIMLKSNKAGFLRGFLDYSYREDLQDGISKILAPIIAVAAVVCGIAEYFFSKNVMLAITAFSAAACVCVPISSLLPANFVLRRACKKLVKKGVMIAGYDACGDIDEADTVLLKSSDLFPDGTITLNGIKTFMGGRIDEAILDAASVVLNTDSTLCELFLNVIAGRKELLKPVDSLAYEDGMGLSAWVDGKRVLIGNRELQINHGGDVPSKDYESRYLNDGIGIIYLSTSGVLAAAFLVKYNETPEITESLHRFEKMGINVVVMTTDANLTSSKITEVFGLEEMSVKVIPSALHEEVGALLRDRPLGEASVAHLGTVQSLTNAVRATAKIKSSVMTAALIMLIGVIVGYAFISYFVFFQSLSKLTFLPVLAYQLLFTVASMLIPNFRSY